MRTQNHSELQVREKTSLNKTLPGSRKGLDDNEPFLTKCFPLVVGSFLHPPADDNMRQLLRRRRMKVSELLILCATDETFCLLTRDLNVVSSDDDEVEMFI